MKAIEGKELHTASWLSSVGIKVHFRNMNNHDNKSDTELLGDFFDIKRVTSSSKWRISDIVRRKLKTQGPGFVIDLSQSDIALEDAMSECAYLLENEKVERLLIIKDAKLYELAK